MAGLASIASSPAPGWELEASAPIEMTTVPAGPATAFGITAEGRGPRNGHQGGDLEVTVELRPGAENVEPASVTVTLISEADPSLRETQQIDVFSSAPDNLFFFMPTFGACTAGPCFEDFRLEVSTATANTSVVVSGTVRATLRGRDQNPEPDSEILVEVTSLGVAP